jgi:uncharacterized protein YecT (DUF1311 family)
VRLVRVSSLFLALFAFSHAELASAQAVPRAEASSRPEGQCDRASSQAETFSCYFELAATSRAEVQRAFDRSLESAIARDRELKAYPHARDMPSASLVERLKRSQTAWLQYSDAQCGLEGETSFGGSGTDILNAKCRYRMNSNRLEELEAARQLLER